MRHLSRAQVFVWDNKVRALRCHVMNESEQSVWCRAARHPGCRDQTLLAETTALDNRHCQLLITVCTGCLTLLLPK